MGNHEQSVFMGPKEIVALCDIGRTKAYEIIRKMNKSLEKMGKLTMPGKVQREYFYSQIYGFKKEQLKKDGKLFLEVEEMCATCGIKEGVMYKKVREANRQLAADGWLTLRGKLPVNYFREKWFYNPASEK